MTAQDRMPAQQRSGAAVGWTVFAAVVLGLIGCFHMMTGLGGIIGDSVYVATPNYVFQFDTTTWGWVHLIVGLVVFCAAFGLFRGAVWARTVGVLVAAISAITTFAWMPAYPVWALVILAVDITVIWALTAHGRDITLEH